MIANQRRVRHGRRAESGGFTLLELMIVVVIVAILAVLAVSGYGFAVVKSRRAAAEGCLQEAAQAMERYYTTNLTYATAPVPTCSQAQNVTPYYGTVGMATTATPPGYTLTLTPNSKQKDSSCGTLSINQAGIKTANGTSGVAGCW